MRKIKPYEILAVSAILISAIFSFVFIKYFQSMGKFAVITVNSEIVKEINLKTTDKQIFQIKNITIEIKDNKIRVLTSDCPDKICMHKGYISNTGESIVCMPNKLIIEIKESHE